MHRWKSTDTLEERVAYNFKEKDEQVTSMKQVANRASACCFVPFLQMLSAMDLGNDLEKDDRLAGKRCVHLQKYAHVSEEHIAPDSGSKSKPS
jgi:hypothetical protein